MKTTKLYSQLQTVRTGIEALGGLIFIIIGMMVYSIFDKNGFAEPDDDQWDNPPYSPPQPPLFKHFLVGSLIFAGVVPLIAYLIAFPSSLAYTVITILLFCLGVGVADGLLQTYLLNWKHQQHPSQK